MQNRGKAIHSEQENGLKPHFGPFLALIGPIRGPTKIFQHLKHHQVLDIITPRYDIQNRQKLMHFDQENGLKPVVIWRLCVHDLTNSVTNRWGPLKFNLILSL